LIKTSKTPSHSSASVERAVASWSCLLHLSGRHFPSRRWPRTTEFKAKKWQDLHWSGQDQYQD